MRSYAIYPFRKCTASRRPSSKVLQLAIVNRFNCNSGDRVDAARTLSRIDIPIYFGFLSYLRLRWSIYCFLVLMQLKLVDCCSPTFSILHLLSVRRTLHHYPNQVFRASLQITFLLCARIFFPSDRSERKHKSRNLIRIDCNRCRLPMDTRSMLTLFLEEWCRRLIMPHRQHNNITWNETHTHTHTQARTHVGMNMIHWHNRKPNTENQNRKFNE